jgi:hypothetical protein
MLLGGILLVVSMCIADSGKSLGFVRCIRAFGMPTARAIYGLES